MRIVGERYTIEFYLEHTLPASISLTYVSMLVYVLICGGVFRFSRCACRYIYIYKFVIYLIDIYIYTHTAIASLWLVLAVRACE